MSKSLNLNVRRGFDGLVISRTLREITKRERSAPGVEARTKTCCLFLIGYRPRSIRHELSQFRSRWIVPCQLPFPWCLSPERTNQRPFACLAVRYRVRYRRQIQSRSYVPVES